MWSSLIRNLGCEEVGPGGTVLLSQHINQRLFEEILRARTSLINDSESNQRPLTIGEANALHLNTLVTFHLPSKRNFLIDQNLFKVWID